MSERALFPTQIGQLLVTVHQPGGPTGERTYTARWEGPPTILISPELMAEHIDPPFHLAGDDLTICQYRLRITGRTPAGDYIAERVDQVLVAVPIRAAQLTRWEAAVRRNFGGLTYPHKQLALLPNQLQTNGRHYEPNAIARNLLLEACLGPQHTHVLWVDADLVRVPPDLIEQLLAVSRVDVVAPLVFVEQPGGWFYDTGGFRRAGLAAAMHPPIFPGYAGGLLELESVGTCYLAPAEIYREHGLRYSVTGGEVEHVGLLAQARALGYRVWATDSCTVEHAYLPNHGEGWRHVGAENA
jgi:hypothetical protein